MNKLIAILASSMACALIFLSCHKAVNDKQVSSKTIKLDYQKMIFFDTNCFLPGNGKTFKMLIYRNIDFCLECALQQYEEYEQFAFDNKIPLITLISIQKDDFGKLRYYLQSLHTKYPVVIDTANIFIKDNSKLGIHSGIFLLDDKDNIIVAGDPITNRSVKNEYSSLLVKHTH